MKADRRVSLVFVAAVLLATLVAFAIASVPPNASSADLRGAAPAVAIPTVTTSPTADPVPAKLLPRVLSGLAALQTLKDLGLLDVVAALNQKTVRELEAIMNDPSARIDPTGALFYVDGVYIPPTTVPDSTTVATTPGSIPPRVPAPNANTAPSQQAPTTSIALNPSPIDCRPSLPSE